MGSLASPGAVKDIINRFGFKFKKSLGQNFLIDQNIVQKICKAADLEKTDLVVEIGPGIGSLTEELAREAGHVLAVELDKRLIGILQENLQGLSNITVVNDDILKVNLDDLVASCYQGYGKGAGSYKVVANLPYYITTPVLMYLLESGFNISETVVMIQKEVAERMVASPGSKEYGALTIAINYHTEARLAMKVAKNVFMPKPEVDSAVVKLTRRQKPLVDVVSEKWLFRVIKAAFGQRRKTLLNSLSNGLGMDKEKVARALSVAGIDADLRGESLSLEQFALLSSHLIEVANLDLNNI